LNCSPQRSQRIVPRSNVEVVTLRGDLERFGFLLGGSHGEGLFGATVGE
jgi:hypothetical protein